MDAFVIRTFARLPQLQRDHGGAIPTMWVR
jgi:hypothetical protein